jgi:membrane protein YqaA with SNARE-associated domain
MYSIHSHNVYPFCFNVGCALHCVTAGESWDLFFALSISLCLISASLGNTAGGMTCYYMGRLGRIDWIEKYFKVKKEKIDKMQRFLQGKGALMAFFAFLPAIGEVISIALGYMRSNVWLTTASMFAGKLIRYIILLKAMQEALNLVM